MINKMKLFQVIQKNLAMLGISSNQQRYCNQKSVMTLFVYSLAITLSMVFLFFKADTYLEYTLNIYVTSTAFGACVGFIALLFQKGKLFKLIDELEEFFNESKY